MRLHTPTGLPATTGRLPPPRRRHEEVADRLRALIRESLRPGDRLPAVRTLMAELGVSMTTLRAAQAVLAHEGLVELRQGAGVFVAPPRPPAGPRRVGVWTELDALRQGGSDCYRELARETIQTLRARGFSPRLYSGTLVSGEDATRATCPEFLDDVASGHLSAAVVLNAPSTEDMYWQVQRLAVPAVGALTAYAPEHSNATMIAPGLAALRERGVQRVALVAWDLTHEAPQFRRLVDALGMTTRPEWQRGEFHPACPGSGWEAFRELWLAGREHPDGLLIADYLLFADVACAIRELGLAVPARLQVATHAVGPAPAGRAPFPHVRIEFQPADHAAALVDLLEQRLGGQPPPAQQPTLPFTVAAVGGYAGAPITAALVNRGAPR